MTQGSRAVGTLTSSMFSTFWPVPVSRASMIGDAATTVMASVTAGVSSKSNSVFLPRTTSTSRLTVENPGSSAVTV